ncbi:hypothetical protein JC221_134 [Yersinia phage JC221]|nr:hypothetical protein JC221_134 [Yersinia phage JC221]
MKLTRYRLATILNDTRKDVTVAMNKALADFGYDVTFNFNSYHLADRIIDRSHNHEKTVKLVCEMVTSLAKHYMCNVLFFAEKSKADGGKSHNVILYRTINRKVTAIPAQIRMYWDEETQKHYLMITCRTFMDNYDLDIAGKHKINVDYKYPKINFEYNGYRRVMSRLDRLISSPECPDGLKMLRV